MLELEFSQFIHECCKEETIFDQVRIGGLGIWDIQNLDIIILVTESSGELLSSSGKNLPQCLNSLKIGRIMRPVKTLAGHRHMQRPCK